jgi:hypothetical protein
MEVMPEGHRSRSDEAMSIKDKFSADEWNDLTNAPIAAGLYVSAREPHPIHMMEYRG